MAKVDRATQQATIAANIKDNTTEFINPEREREVMNDEVDSALYAIDDTGSAKEIPFTNETDDGLDYDPEFVYDKTTKVLNLGEGNAASDVTGLFKALSNGGLTNIHTALNAWIQYNGAATKPYYINITNVKGGTLANWRINQFGVIEADTTDASGIVTVHGEFPIKRSDQLGFYLQLQETAATSAADSLGFEHSVPSNYDTGAVPVVVEQIRRFGGLIANRVLKVWRNYTTTVLQLDNDGGLSKDGTNAVNFPKMLDLAKTTPSVKAKETFASKLMEFNNGYLGFESTSSDNDLRESHNAYYNGIWNAIRAGYGAIKSFTELRADFSFSTNEAAAPDDPLTMVSVAQFRKEGATFPKGITSQQTNTGDVLAGADKTFWNTLNRGDVLYVSCNRKGSTDGNHMATWLIQQAGATSNTIITAIAAGSLVSLSTSGGNQLRINNDGGYTVNYNISTVMIKNGEG